MRRIQPTMADFHARIQVHIGLGDTPEDARQHILDEDHLLAIKDERDGYTKARRI